MSLGILRPLFLVGKAGAGELPPRPVVFFELDHRSRIPLDIDGPTRDHAGSPNGNDYGKDLLRMHYERHDHSHPHTPHRQGRV